MKTKSSEALCTAEVVVPTVEDVATGAAAIGAGVLGPAATGGAKGAVYGGAAVRPAGNIMVVNAYGLPASAGFGQGGRLMVIVAFIAFLLIHSLSSPWTSDI